VEFSFIPEGVSPLQAPRHWGTVSKWQAGLE